MPRPTPAPPPAVPSPAAPDTGPTPDAVGERILDAALTQFALLGIRRSSVDDVARRAGVGRVTVFRRFGSKDGLVDALVLREARLLMARAEAATEQLDTVEDQLVEGFLLCVSAARTHPLLHGLLATEPDVILPLLTVDGAPALALGQAVVARHLDAAGFTGDAAEVAELMTRIGLSLVLTPTATFALDTDDAIRDFARRYLLPLAGTATEA